MAYSKTNLTDDNNLIDQLLKEQRSLGAVERFSQQHENETSPIQEAYYKDLIPIRKPSTGEQYSFEVDLDKCTGCKACVVACHSLNGLAPTESWRDVGHIVTVEELTQDQQTVTTACHHCLDPGCLEGCPVGAYEKIKDTGVVKHLDDQCIGCQYCSLKCPYDVPKYNDKLGIVRKCDMCHERLEEGEAPACVQSCPNGAIKIKLVSQEEVRNTTEEGSIIPGAYDSNYTRPSTTYVSSRNIETSSEAADEYSLEASHNHVPLVWMLMLTQVAVGVSLADLIARFISPAWYAEAGPWMLALATVLGGVGLVSSIFHLGSPLGAWRIFLGLKTSWLSREAVLFGLWKPLLIASAALAWFPTMQETFGKSTPILHHEQVTSIASTALIPVCLGSVFFGLISVYCSVMVYADTHRDYWRLDRTLTRFGLTTLLGGSAALCMIPSLQANHSSATCMIFILCLLAKSVFEVSQLKASKNKEWSYAKKSALIKLITLKSLTLRRGVFLALGLVFGLMSTFHPVFAVFSFISILIGEWLERSLFFQAVVTLKMPGGFKK